MDWGLRAQCVISKSNVKLNEQIKPYLRIVLNVAFSVQLNLVQGKPATSFLSAKEVRKKLIQKLMLDAR